MKAYPFFSVAVFTAVISTFSCSSGGDDSGDSSSSYGGGQGNGSSSSGLTYGDKTYGTVRIGDQVWFAENLNYDVAGSKCNGERGRVTIGYDEEKDDYIWKTLTDKEVQANCDKYGRLYDWATSMALSSSCNENSCSSQIQPKHKGICPNGWHIPSNDDWDKLLRYVDNENGGDGDDELGDTYYSYTAGKYLKAADGWNWNDYDGISGNGTDKYGFSALPAGYGDSDGSFFSDDSFFDVGYDGIWWSTSEYSNDNAYYRRMSYSNEYAYWYNYEKSILFSVRCLQD